MKARSSVIRCQLTITDLNRNRYETSRLTTAFMDDESTEHLVLRLLTIGLLPMKPLTFGRGVCSGHDPDVMQKAMDDHLLYWIDAGFPAVNRLKRARHHADHVLVTSLLSSDWLEQARINQSALEDVELLLIDNSLVKSLEDNLTRSVDWAMIIDGARLTVTEQGKLYEGTCYQFNSPSELDALH